MRRTRETLFGIVAATIVSAGCGPSLSEEDLGTIEFRVPEVPGAEKPYELPSVAPAEPSAAVGQ